MTSNMDSQGDLNAALQGLLDGCANSDAAALQRLYELAAPVLFATLTRILRRRALAEEALQDVFVSVWQRASQFRMARGQPMAWLMSIARYRAIDLLRRERRAPLLVTEIPEKLESAEASSEEDLATWHSEPGLLERCMALLSPEQKHCLELAFVGGNSHHEIAQLTGSPLGSVKSWIRRGLLTLRHCLEGRP